MMLWQNLTLATTAKVLAALTSRGPVKVATNPPPVRPGPKRS